MRSDLCGLLLLLLLLILVLYRDECSQKVKRLLTLRLLLILSITLWALGQQLGETSENLLIRQIVATACHWCLWLRHGHLRR